MHSDSHIKWLKENNLLELVKHNQKHFEHVLKNSLKINNEKLLIIGDQGYNNRQIAALICAGYYLAAKDLGINAKLIIQQVKNAGDKADEAVIKALRDLPNNSIVAISLSNKLGSIKGLSLSYRKYMKEKGHRFISTLSMGNLTTTHFPYLINCINIDYSNLREKGSMIKQKLDQAKKVRITTEKGTDVTLDIEGKFAISNDANYTKNGSGGNIPAGEVYIAPNGKHNVNGVVVIDGSIRHQDGTTLVNNPVTMHIQNGEVISFEGEEEARLLEETMNWAKARAKKPENIALIGELGIGINPRATIVGATVIDEKKYKSAHIAIGSNTWFGGDIKTIIHLDQVFNNPTIYLDDKKLEY